MYRQKVHTKIEITENLEFRLKIQNLIYRVFKHPIKGNVRCITETNSVSS
jgi:hypothetical protein